MTNKTYSDSSVRDHRQTAKREGDLIIVRSYVGKTLTNIFSVPWVHWISLTNLTLAPRWEKEKFIHERTAFMDDEPGGPEQADRIRDSMVKVIEQAYKGVK